MACTSNAKAQIIESLSDIYIYIYIGLEIDAPFI